MTHVSLAKKIAWARDGRGESLETVAKLAGITKSHLWDLERGRSKNPTVRTLAGLSEALHAPFGELAEAAFNDLRATLTGDNDSTS